MAVIIKKIRLKGSKGEVEREAIFDQVLLTPVFTRSLLKV